MITAGRLFIQREYEEVINVLLNMNKEEINNLEKDSIVNYYNILIISLIKEEKEAIDFIEEYETKYPDDIYFYYLIGTIYMEEEKCSDAYEYYQLFCYRIYNKDNI